MGDGVDDRLCDIDSLSKTPLKSRLVNFLGMFLGSQINEGADAPLGGAFSHRHDLPQGRCGRVVGIDGFDIADFIRPEAQELHTR